MKELTLVYLILASITGIGCAARVYDLDTPSGRRQIAEEETVRLLAVNGNTLLVDNVRVEGDSLVFMTLEKAGRHEWRHPGSIAISDVASVEDTVRGTEPVYFTVILVGLAFVFMMIGKGLSEAGF